MLDEETYPLGLLTPQTPVTHATVACGWSRAEATLGLPLFLGQLALGRSYLLLFATCSALQFPSVVQELQLQGEVAWGAKVN